MSRRSAVAGLLAAILAVALVAGVAGCSSSSVGADIPTPSGVPDETAAVSVFYSTGRTLVEEPRVLPAKEIHKTVLDELLLAQPQLFKDIAIVQPEATVNSVTVKDGVATVDWSKEVLAFQAEDKEKILALAAVLRTLGQFPEIKKVQFTVEGKTTGQLGSHDIQTFWGDKVSLKSQPWDVLRAPATTTTTGASKDTTTTAGGAATTTSTPGTTTTTK